MTCETRVATTRTSTASSTLREEASDGACLRLEIPEAKKALKKGGIQVGDRIHTGTAESGTV